MTYLEFKIYVAKAVVITLCIAFLLYLFLPDVTYFGSPRYHFIDKDTRCNVYTGRIDKFSNWDQNWK